MARKVLLTDVAIAGLGIAKAGTTYDTALQAKELVAIEAGGGVTMDASLLPSGVLDRIVATRNRNGSQGDLIVALLASFIADLERGQVNRRRITEAGQTLEANTYTIASGTATTATLPLASSCDLQVIVVHKSNLAADMTIGRSGADTINGATSYVMSGDWTLATFVADGANNAWLVSPPA